MFWLQHPESSTEETLEILKTAVSKYETANNRVHRTRHKVSRPLTRDVELII